MKGQRLSSVLVLVVLSVGLHHHELVDAFVVSSRVRKAVGAPMTTTTTLHAAANSYLQGLSAGKGHPTSEKTKNAQDYLQSLESLNHVEGSVGTHEKAAAYLECSTATLYGAAAVDKTKNRSNVATSDMRQIVKSSKTQLETPQVGESTFTATRPRPSTTKGDALTTTYPVTKKKKMDAREYLESLASSSTDGGYISGAQTVMKSLDSPMTSLPNAEANLYHPTHQSPEATTRQKSSRSQDYLQSLELFDTEIKADTQKATAYLDCTIAALYSAAKNTDTSTLKTDSAASTGTFEETQKVTVMDTKKDTTTVHLTSKSTDTGQCTVSPIKSTVEADNVERLSEEFDLVAKGILQEDGTRVEDEVETTAVDALPGIYTTITEDMARRVTMAADFVMEKSPTEMLDYITKELSVGELTDLVAGGLVSLGEVFVVAFSVLVQVVSGQDLSDLVSGAQKAVKNVVATSVASLSNRAKEIGDMEVSKVTQSMIELLASIWKALFRMLNAVVEIVAGKNVNEIGDTAAQSIEKQTNEVLATVNDLSDKSLQELATMLTEFEAQAAEVVVATTTAAVESIGADLGALTGLKAKAGEFGVTPSGQSKTSNNENVAAQGA